jgi:hypothetical protein
MPENKKHRYDTTRLTCEGALNTWKWKRVIFATIQRKETRHLPCQRLLQATFSLWQQQARHGTNWFIANTINVTIHRDTAS